MPQFIVVLVILCAIVLVSQIARLAEVLVNFGFSVENILMPQLFVILPFLTYSIPWAFLFAVIVSIGRISGDGEYTAMLAGGYSLVKMARPV